VNIFRIEYISYEWKRLNCPELAETREKVDGCEEVEQERKVGLDVSSIAYTKRSRHVHRLGYANVTVIPALVTCTYTHYFHYLTDFYTAKLPVDQANIGVRGPGRLCALDRCQCLHNIYIQVDPSSIIHPGPWLHFQVADLVKCR
jgi:hypothetical protein